MRQSNFSGPLTLAPAVPAGGRVGGEQPRHNMSTNFSNYTVRIRKDPEFYGSTCTQEDADRITQNLSRLLRERFPGINIETGWEGRTSSSVTCPETDVAEQISDWIANNWTSAL